MELLPTKPVVAINDVIRKAIDASDSPDPQVIADAAFLLVPDDDLAGYFHQLLRDRVTSYLSADRRSAINGSADSDDAYSTSEPVAKRKTRRDGSPVRSGHDNKPRVDAHRERWAKLLHTSLPGVQGKRIFLGDATVADFQLAIVHCDRQISGYENSKAQYEQIIEALETAGVKTVKKLPRQQQEELAKKLAR